MSLVSPPNRLASSTLKWLHPLKALNIIHLKLKIFKLKLCNYDTLGRQTILTDYCTLSCSHSCIYYLGGLVAVIESSTL